MRTLVSWSMATISLLAMDLGTKFLANKYCPPFIEKDWINIGTIYNSNVIHWHYVAIVLSYVALIRIPPIAKCLIIAGGLGNFIENHVLGNVTDFIGLRTGTRTWTYVIFNMADTMLMFGILILLASCFRLRAKYFIPGAAIWQK